MEKKKKEIKRKDKGKILRSKAIIYKLNKIPSYITQNRKYIFNIKRTSQRYQKKKESSPIPWFKSINSSALNFLYSPTLTSILNAEGIREQENFF